MSSSRAKLFIENFFAYGFIQVLNYVIPFLLLPVITRLLSDPSDFGVFDMFNLIVGFGSPLVVLGMYDAMFREYFEKEDQEYRYNVTTTAQRIVFTTSIIVCSTLLFFNASFSKLFFSVDIYGNIIVYSAIALFLSANRNLIQAPTRIQNKRKIFLVSGLLSSSCTYLISIIFLYLGFSYFGLIYSNIIVTGLLLLFFWVLNKNFFLTGKFDKKIAKELFKIGLPLVPTFLIYWVYNSLDRIMITNILGTTELGIYSIGSRVAHISQFIYLAFTGGFSYFKYTTMKDDDQVQMNSKLFEYMGIISFLSLLCVYPFLKLIFSILFENSYVLGYIVTPYLFISPLLLMLFQIVGSQFIVIKKSYLTTITLALGAICNIILNAYLIPSVGIEGGAIATVVGYLLSVIIVSVLAINRNLLIIRRRFLLFSVFTIVYILINRIAFHGNLSLSIIGTFIGILLALILYNDEVRKIFKMLRKNKSV
jgi:O-antigen/teichoic acid export membrane protein